MPGNDVVRLIKPWGAFSAGAVFTDMSKAQRDLLIERGLAEPAETEKKTRKFRLRAGK